LAPKHLLVTLLLAALLLGAWEGLLTTQGALVEPYAHQPARWQARRAAARALPARLTFLGTSRTRCGIVPAVVAEACGLAPEAVVNLGVDNTPPLPILEDLLARGWPRGVVVVEVMPGNFFASPRGAPPVLQDVPPWKEPDRLLREAWRSRTRLSNEENRPQVLGHELGRHWAGKAHHPLRDPSHRLHPDGWLEFRPHGDATTRASPQVWFRQYAPLDEAGLSQLLGRLAGQVRALELAGIEVVFLRLPSSGWWARAETEVFPRARYWDRLARAFPGRCLWVGEAPLDLELELPDGSHLESASARAFSARLGSVLAGRLGQQR
jgi:hypothetical protein